MGDVGPYGINWNEKSKGVALVKRLSGILVILGGIYMVFSAV